MALERVKLLAAKRDGLCVQKDKARRFFSSDAEAKSVIRAVITRLSPEDFAETVQLTWDVADVYGVVQDGAGWYLKITIDEEIPEVAVISFHPLKRRLKTNAGMVKP